MAAARGRLRVWAGGLQPGPSPSIYMLLRSIQAQDAHEIGLSLSVSCPLDYIGKQLQSEKKQENSRTSAGACSPFVAWRARLIRRRLRRAVPTLMPSVVRFASLLGLLRCFFPVADLLSMFPLLF